MEVSTALPPYRKELHPESGFGSWEIHRIEPELGEVSSVPAKRCTSRSRQMNGETGISAVDVALPTVAENEGDFRAHY